MKNKNKILFTSTIFTSFIREDLTILQKKFPVKRITGSGIYHLLRIIFLIPSSSVAFTWFASVYSAFVVFFAKLFGKRSIIVIGGVDVSKNKPINYGIWLSPWKSIFVRYAIRNADRILSVDPFLISEAKRLAKYNGANIVYLPTGYDYNYWTPAGAKEKFVLSVGTCENEWRMMTKGFDKLIAASIKLPDVKFVIVGIKENLLKRIKPHLPQNVEVVPPLSRDELLDYYRRAKVYAQVSFTEGLPNALCEAMLCECIPVGTTRGGVPTAIGDVGILLPYGDVDALVDGLNKALKMSDEEGKKARRRIIENFPIQRRIDGLISVIEELSA
ncbi:MAG: glycosyltransferase family 4 protein [Bacteroidetes bacterium]|nr:glycosyltransferase family 4 protein [Bacteroidota bacterium]MBU1423885.1 glycosyltransferase family 4 protein [Bacteroidota bacterium]MBU2471595.1 glycosyltransferase family 4 protein [Bacteroidota bacterium]